MSQELVKKEAANIEESDGLTTMQRRFCDYLIFNEGRTTHQDAALKAGYAEVGAKQEAYRLLKNPKIQNYIARRSAEVNRSFAVTKHNYVRRQQVLSQKLVQEQLVLKFSLMLLMTVLKQHKIINHLVHMRS